MFQVIKAKYQGGTKISYRNKEVVIVEEHTKCKCDCRKKESDCNSRQRYDKRQCSCTCINTDDINKCLSVNK